MKAREIILRPLITEKTTLMQERENTVCFEVDRRANKIMVGKAVEELFDVRVIVAVFQHCRNDPSLAGHAQALGLAAFQNGVAHDLARLSSRAATSRRFAPTGKAPAGDLFASPQRR